MINTLALQIYSTGVVFTLIVIAFLIFFGEEFDEIDNAWDWLVYGFVWPIFPLKALIKLLKNMF
jgi:hypothetical protein